MISNSLAVQEIKDAILLLSEMIDHYASLFGKGR